MADDEWGNLLCHILINFKVFYYIISWYIVKYLTYLDAEDYEIPAPVVVAKVSDKWEGEDEEEPVKVKILIFIFN